MRRIPEDEPLRTTPNHEHVPSVSEMDGLIELGMKDEALRHARLNLKQNTVTAKALNEALEAIQTLADKTKSWAKLVESAYQRLPKRERPAVRFLVMSFRNSCRDHEGVLRLIPKRFTGEYGLVELKESSQVVLLRVGIDTGCGGMLGPIFKDRSFEFIPIDSDSDCLQRTYANTQGRHGRKLIECSPNRLKDRMENSFMHFDPEFDSFTYGDPMSPKQSLANLRRGDLLVFYAGLRGWGDCTTPPALYVVGYFVVEHAGRYNALKREGVLDAFAKNWHILNEHQKDRFDRLILVKGGKGSRLLHKAVKISAEAKAVDRGGHPVFVLDPQMQRHFGTFTELNAIQRSAPRWVKPEFCDKAAAFVMTLR